MHCLLFIERMSLTERINELFSWLRDKGLKKPTAQRNKGSENSDPTLLVVLFGFFRLVQSIYCYFRNFVLACSKL